MMISRPKLVFRFMLRIFVRLCLGRDDESSLSFWSYTSWWPPAATSCPVSSPTMDTTDTARLRGAGTGLEKTLAFVCGSSGAATKRSSSGGENVSPIYQSVTLSTLLLKCSWKYFIKIYQGPLYKLSQPSFHGNCVVGGEIVSKQNSPHSKVETGWDGQRF